MILLQCILIIPLCSAACFLLPCSFFLLHDGFLQCELITSRHLAATSSAGFGVVAVVDGRARLTSLELTVSLPRVECYGLNHASLTWLIFGMFGSKRLITAVQLLLCVFAVIRFKGGCVIM